MISVIIPIGGGRPERKQRLETYLNVTLRGQKNSNFEVIIVEQSLDNRLYYDAHYPYHHVVYEGIRDPLERGFNESWCYNVGVRKANGNILAFLGMDFVFGADFLRDAEIALQDKDFIFACETCVFAKQTDTDKFYENKDVNWLLDQPGYASFTPKRGAAVGISFVKKDAYLLKYRGWVENFFGWGSHDKIFGQVVAAANRTLMPTLPFLPHKIVHLCHDKERHLDLVNEKSDKLYKACEDFGFHNIPAANQLCGRTEAPYMLCLE